MSNSVKDRSGQGMLPKAQRRALGKAAAAKRAAQRRRRELLSRIGKIAAPVGLVLVVIGAVWLFTGNDAPPAATPQASSPAGENTTAPASVLPPGADPALATKPVVTAGPPASDLNVTPLITGTGAATASGQTITVNYVGVTLATGVEFDSSWTHNDTFSFTLGAGEVIKGWDQGLIGIPVGSRVQIDIPEALAYPGGDGPTGDLRFVVDVLKAE